MHLTSFLICKNCNEKVLLVKCKKNNFKIFSCLFSFTTILIYLNNKFYVELSSFSLCLLEKICFSGEHII